MGRIWPQTVGWTMPGFEPGPVWWRDLSGKVTRSEVQRFRQSWDALQGIQDVNIIIVLLLSFITKQTVWIHRRIFFYFYFFNSFIVQKSSSHMFNQSAVESCRYVGDVEDGAESPGMFDWFFNVFLFFSFFFEDFKIQPSVHMSRHKAELLTHHWVALFSVTDSSWRPTSAQQSSLTTPPAHCVLRVTWPSPLTHTHTQDAGLLQRPLPPSGRTHRQAELSLLFFGRWERLRTGWPRPLCRRTNRLESFVGEFSVFTVVQKRLKIKQILKHELNLQVAFKGLSLPVTPPTPGDSKLVNVLESFIHNLKIKVLSA